MLYYRLDKPLTVTPLSRKKEYACKIREYRSKYVLWNIPNNPEYDIISYGVRYLREMRNKFYLPLKVVI